MLKIFLLLDKNRCLIKYRNILIACLLSSRIINFKDKIIKLKDKIYIRMSQTYEDKYDMEMLISDIINTTNIHYKYKNYITNKCKKYI